MSPGTQNELITFLKERLDLRIVNMPQYHNGEQGPLYLALVLNDEIVATLNARELQAVLDEKESLY